MYVIYVLLLVLLGSVLHAYSCILLKQRFFYAWTLFVFSYSCMAPTFLFVWNKELLDWTDRCAFWFYTGVFYLVTPDPVCQQTDIGNGTLSWNSTLTSLEGDVTCDTDFMYTSVDTAVRCHDNGAWDPPIGQCLQYYWRNVSRSVYVSESTDYSIANARLSSLTAQNDGHY